jgi:hypothetical protein
MVRKRSDTKRQKLSARRWIERENGYKEEKPFVCKKNVIETLGNADLNCKVLLLCRVSSSDQDRNGSLKAQSEWCRKSLVERGYELFSEFLEVASGWAEDRDVLIRAAKKAKQIGAVLVAESTDRFIRPRYFNPSKNPDAWPSDEEFCRLHTDTLGVPLRTILPWNWRWSRVRAHQIRRGQLIKDRKGGRPKIKKPGYKKLLRFTNISKIYWLRLCGVMSHEIRDLTGIPKRTLQRWLNGRK